MPGSPFVTGGSGDGGGLYAAGRVTTCISANLLFASNDGNGSVSVFTINGGNGVLDCPCHPASFRPDGAPTNQSYSLPHLDLVSVRVTDAGRVEVLGT